MSKLIVPESLKEEHEEFIEWLKSHSDGNGQTGAALRHLLKLLEPHIERENEMVLPLLGALGGLAAGKPPENTGTVARAYEKYAGQYQTMFAEHSPIRLAIRRARKAAKVAGRGDAVEILDALSHHSRVEEEVLYPAALLVGIAAKRSRQAAELSSRTPAAKTVERSDQAGGPPYYALDYDAPISSVTKRLIAKHDEINAIMSEVGELADEGKLKVAISLLNVTSPLILRSAVEEEARVMRVVMAKNKSRDQRSVAIEREHKDIVDFLKRGLPELGSKSPEEARRCITEFVKLVQSHLREEEEIPFSLAASE